MANELIKEQTNNNGEDTHPAQILRAMNEFRKEGFLCDATITVKGGFKLSAHRAVLAASSCYFRKLFEYNSQQKLHGEVEVDWLCSTEMEELLQFMYTGEINMCQDRVEVLIAASGYFVIEGLQEQSTEFLLKNLNPFNCSATLSLADEYGYHTLKSSCTQFLRCNILAASRTPAFLCLTKALVQEVIRDNDAVMANQTEDVYNAVILWISYDLQNRAIHFEDLFSCVRLFALSKEFLVGTVAREVLVQQNATSLAQVKSAIQSVFTRDNRTAVGKGSISFRESVNVVVICGGTSSKYVTLNSKNTIGFVPAMDRWLDMTNMVHGRRGHATTVCNGNLYCLGNHSAFEQESSREVELFDSATSTWNLSSPMPKGRCFHAAVSLGGQLYVLGGLMFDGSWKEASRQVSRYNPVVDRWYPVAAMKCTRQGLCAVVLDGAIFAIGGCDLEDDHLKIVERYDPAQDQWKFVGSMVQARCFACATVVKGKILVVGGRDNTVESGILASCEQYDPANDTWTFEAGHLCTARFAAGIATLAASSVYVFGGESEDDAVDDVERWDVETRQWTVVSKMPFSVSYLQAQVVCLPKQILD